LNSSDLDDTGEGAGGLLDIQDWRQSSNCQSKPGGRGGGCGDGGSLTSTAADLQEKALRYWGRCYLGTDLLCWCQTGELPMDC